MTITKSPTLEKFLRSKRVQKVLSAKPGEDGFSLIELVVVIAILGILIAIALPNFLGVQKDAKINQAKNTLATIVKECAVKGVRSGSETVGFASGTGRDALVQAAAANLNDYTIENAASGGAALTASSGNPCMTAYAVNSTGQLPTFGINSANGQTVKQCWGGSDYNDGCYSNASLASFVSGAGVAGSW